VAPILTVLTSSAITLSEIVNTSKADITALVNFITLLPLTEQTLFGM